MVLQHRRCRVAVCELDGTFDTALSGGRKKEQVHLARDSMMRSLHHVKSTLEVATMRRPSKDIPQQSTVWSPLLGDQQLPVLQGLISVFVRVICIFAIPNATQTVETSAGGGALKIH
eukprot:4062560-Amphidinium_carterae.1